MRHRAPVIGVVVALLLALGTWFGLYKPAMERQAALEAETVELHTRQEELGSEIARLEELRRDEDRVRATAALLQDYLPDGVAQAKAVREFQRTADAARVTISSVSFADPVVVPGAPQPSAPDTALASVEISMVVEGGYFQTVDFFRRVEREVPRAVLTRSVNLTEGERGFPSLATTWSGQLFAVVPVVPSPVADPATEEVDLP